MINCDGPKTIIKGDHVDIMTEFQTLIYSMLKSNEFKKYEIKAAVEFVLDNYEGIQKVESLPVADLVNNILEEILK